MNDAISRPNDPTEGDKADGDRTDDDIGSLADYDAMPSSDPLPDTILPRTPTGDDDEDTINITEHEGPDLNGGNDVDTGAGGRGVGDGRP